MGDTSLLVMSFQASISVLDFHVAFKQAAELERSEVDVPDAVIDFLQADVFADADGGNVDPLGVPADAAVGADVAGLEAIRILELWQPGGHEPGRRLVE